MSETLPDIMAGPIFRKVSPESTFSFKSVSDFISLPFFLLEKISQSIQDPFENKPMDTAMNSISSNIENNIKDLMGVPSSAAVNNDDHFYHL